MGEHTRMLNRALDISKYQEVEGGLLVKDVPLLAAGTWTDSAVGTPLYYGPEVLKACAANWNGDGYWSRHRGGTPRSVLELIGWVRDPRFDPAFIEEGMAEPGAIMGDLFYDYSTKNGRDAAQQALSRAQTGKPLAVSVEHGGAEAYNPRTGRNEATDLTFFGLASVERGACEACRLPKRAAEASIGDPLVDLGYRSLDVRSRITSLSPKQDRFLHYVELGRPTDLEVPDGYHATKSEPRPGRY